AAPAPVAASAAPVAATASPRNAFWWAPLPLAAAAAAVALAFVGGWWPVTEKSAAPFSLTASADIGGLRRVDLPDGSVIQLNTDSAVEVRYEAAERRVRLTRGEAHFTVAKNPA